MKFLVKKGETNIMELVHKTNSTWCEVDRNIKFLERLGIIETRSCNKRRLVRLKRKDSRVEAVFKALRILETASLEQPVM